MSAFPAPIAEQIWDMKYRLKAAGTNAPLDADVAATWRRVAQALAAAEAPAERPAWEARFFDALSDFQFLPAGRILAGAGADRSVTLFNCFVMGRIPDNMGGIFDALREAALTLQQGGGVGYDFSTIRPKGAPVAGVAADASGPVSFMDVWDGMCRTIMSAGSRRGAMMATLRCDHPDIEGFVAAKADPSRLRMFNLSVLASDAFMAAVEADAPWPLVFDGVTYKTIGARDLWNQIMRATYDYAEPGVIFIDRINRRNNLWYAETISATNPCGEQPLPPYGACLLGSINLAALVDRPFAANAQIDLERLSALVETAVRMMDNVVDVSRFALEAQAREAQAKRRIGLGVTGLADALAMTGAVYGAEAGLASTRTWLRTVRDAAYRASAKLAAEKGPFPLFDRDKYLAGETVRELPEDIRAEIAEHGIRNALLTSIAPTGTISLYAGNVSSGVEPIFAASYSRRVLNPDGSAATEEVVDYAVATHRRLFGAEAPPPEALVTVADLSPEAHLATQAAAQEFVDSAISKTINLPEDIPFEAFKDVYAEAYRLGCKGCTTYRPNPVTGAVLSASEPAGDDASPPQKVGAEPGGATAAAAAVDGQEASAGQSAAAAASAEASEPADVLAAPPEPTPFARPEALPGATYKLRWPGSAHAMYITMNDIEIDGRRRPFEIFINSKNMEHYAWTVALTRMVSAVFRRGGDVRFVVEELKAVFDPRGGAWMNGVYVPSMLAAIGGVVESHLQAIGFLEAEARLAEQARNGGAAASSPEGFSAPAPRQTAAAAADERTLDAPPPHACDQCGSFNVRLMEGCATCADCGYSSCS